MPDKLKVIALISGGKDSLFSMLHCLANGHEVVALANLHPAALNDAACQSMEDIDSYMYQTIGHGIVPLYQDALGLPLYRGEIMGTAVNTDKAYAYTAAEEPTSGDGNGEVDETESLFTLLRKVKLHHPEANAVSTGAILSDYQRTRVESVALRLALIPLSFLWQYTQLPPYTQDALLHDMAVVGQDARIIKVASGGLDESFLWRNVADWRTISRLHRAMARFGGEQGGAVLGEGGEFESIAIDGPMPLWRRKIDVAEEDRTVVTGAGGNAAIEVRTATTIPKENIGPPPEKVRIPDLLDDEFQDVLARLESETDSKSEIDPHQQSRVIQPIPLPRWKKSIASGICSISNIAAASSESAESQMVVIARALRSHVQDAGFVCDDVVFVTVLLRSMSDFASVNGIYGKLFHRPHPPARVTVACGTALPPGVEIMLSLDINTRRPRVKNGLHVQSRSYWAPANIGPYSQAILVPLADAGTEGEKPALVYVAGQIPLVPSSMAMVSHKSIRYLAETKHPEVSDFCAQAVLSLQHLWRIARAMDVVCWTGVVAFITASTDDRLQSRVSAAAATWRMAHEHAVDAQLENESDENDIDPWDRKYGTSAPSSASASTCRRPLPDFSRVKSVPSAANNHRLSPFFAAQVAELPRGAAIEWHGIGLAHAEVTLDPSVYGESGGWMQSCNTYTSITTSFSAIWFRVLRAEHLPDLSEESGIVTAYMSASAWQDGEMRAWLESGRAKIIPCLSVWDQHGGELMAVVMVHKDKHD